MLENFFYVRSVNMGVSFNLWSSLDNKKLKYLPIHSHPHESDVIDVLVVRIILLMQDVFNCLMPFAISLQVDVSSIGRPQLNNFTGKICPLSRNRFYTSFTILYFLKQWAAVSTQFSLRMVPPQPWSVSHCKETWKGYLPWGASVPFTTLLSPSRRRGTAASRQLVFNRNWIVPHPEWRWREPKCRLHASWLQKSRSFFVYIVKKSAASEYFFIIGVKLFNLASKR